MALSITEANAVSHEFFDKRTVNMNQVYEDDPFLARLLKNKRVKTTFGTDIQFPIRYLKLARADAQGWGKQVQFQTKNTRTGGTISAKLYRTDTMITLQERVQNKGRPKIIDLMADKKREIMEDMMDRMATDVYATNANGLGIDSLATIVDSSSSYAGLAVADAASWAGVEDSSTTELTLYGSNSLSYYVNASTFGKHGPTIMVTSRDLASKAESLIEPQKRYMDKETASMGFRNVMFHDVPIIATPYMTDGSLFGLDESTFQVRVDSDFNLNESDWTDLLQAGFPDFFGKVLTHIWNLQCDLRKSNFKMTALDYTI